jgi:hypothetical protein
MRGTSVNSVTASPRFASDSTIFVGTASEGLFQSADGGESWDTFNAGFTNLTIMAVTLPPAYESGATVFVGTAVGVYRGAGVEPDEPFVPTTGQISQSARILIIVGVIAGIIVLVSIPVMLIRLRRRAIDRRIAGRSRGWSRDTTPE